MNLRTIEDGFVASSFVARESIHPRSRRRSRANDSNQSVICGRFVSRCVVFVKYVVSRRAGARDKNENKTRWNFCTIFRYLPSSRLSSPPVASTSDRQSYGRFSLLVFTAPHFYHDYFLL